MRRKTPEVMSCVGLLMSCLAGDCNPIGQCAPDMSLCKLEIKATSPRVSRSEGGTLFLSLKDDGLAIQPALRLALAASSKPEVLLGEQDADTVLDRTNKEAIAKVTIPREKLTAFPTGPLNLAVSQKNGSLQGATTTRVFLPPMLSVGPTLTASSMITDVAVKELGSVFIQPEMPGKSGWLFVGQQYEKNLNIYRRLVRYDYSGGPPKALAVNNFLNAKKLTGIDPSALFAVSQNAVITDWLVGMTAQVQLYELNASSTGQSLAISAGTPATKPLLAADPSGDTLAIATATEVRLYSVTVPPAGALTTKPLGACSLPDNFQPIALGVQRVEIPQERLRRVIIVSSNMVQQEITVCELQDTIAASASESTKLDHNTMLADCLKPELTELPVKAPVALTMGDLDADGLVDLVYVPKASPTDSIFYIPYAGGKDPNPAVKIDCRFWPKEKVMLPSNVTVKDAQAIAVGNLDGTNGPDIVLATPAELRIFWNNAP